MRVLERSNAALARRKKDLGSERKNGEVFGGVLWFKESKVRT